MKTNSIPLNPASIASGTNDIRAIKPPVYIPNPWFWVWLILALLVFAAAVALLVIYLARRAQKPVFAPVIPPHQRARQKLEEALALIGQPNPFCVAVSDTIRLYLEERFSFHAPERTTEEFLRELQATNLLTPDQKQSLREFLGFCDMVKFARYEPGRLELESLHASAVRLIDETEPQPELLPGAQPQPVQQ